MAVEVILQWMTLRCWMETATKLPNRVSCQNVNHKSILSTQIWFITFDSRATACFQLRYVYNIPLYSKNTKCPAYSNRRNSDFTKVHCICLPYGSNNFCVTYTLQQALTATLKRVCAIGKLIRDGF